MTTSNGNLIGYKVFKVGSKYATGKDNKSLYSFKADKMEVFYSKQVMEEGAWIRPEIQYSPIFLYNNYETALKCAVAAHEANGIKYIIGMFEYLPYNAVVPYILDPGIDRPRRFLLDFWRYISSGRPNPLLNMVLNGSADSGNYRVYPFDQMEIPKDTVFASSMKLVRWM